MAIARDFSHGSSRFASSASFVTPPKEKRKGRETAERAEDVRVAITAAIISGDFSSLKHRRETTARPARGLSRPSHSRRARFGIGRGAMLTFIHYLLIMRSYRSRASGYHRLGIVSRAVYVAPLSPIPDKTNRACDDNAISLSAARRCR